MPPQAASDRYRTQPQRLLFLPGASGDSSFWHPVAGRLRHGAERVHLGWPGFGATPADPGVRGFEDLLGLVLAAIDRPCALIAQSMGGVLAVRAALQQPELVSHLVLCVTSGGIPMEPHGAQDWRQSFRAAHPRVPEWFATVQDDLSAQLRGLATPTLLLWGDTDPISPVNVGEQLAALMPQAQLVVIPAGDHDLALSHAEAVATLIDNHLAADQR